MEDDVPEIIERSADDIAKRSLAVYAVVAHSKGQAWVGEWVERFGIHEFLSESERVFLGSSSPPEQAIRDFSWRAEALVSLVWALGGIHEMPPLSEQAWVLELPFVEQAVRDPAMFRQSAAKRPSSEIEAMEGFLYHQHWRVRDSQLGLNVGASMPLQDGELPIDQLIPSVVYERRYGLSWIVGWGADWDDVPTDT
jgi:hypothetical protein